MASNPNDEQKEAVMWPGYKKTWGWMVWGKSEESLGNQRKFLASLLKVVGVGNFKKWQLRPFWESEQNKHQRTHEPDWWILVTAE